MQKISALVIIVLAVAGAAVGWLLEVALVSSGGTMLVTPITFAALLIIVAVAVVAVALPVRRVAKGALDADGRPARVDPFYATRVLALAKSAILVGAIFAGGTLAMLAFFFSRPVVNGSSVLPSILGFVAAAALLVAGIIAEEMCRIPPKDRQDGPPDGEPSPESREH